MTDWLDAMMIDIHEMESKVPYWLDEANTVVRVAQEFFVRVGARIAMFHIDRHYDAIPSAGYVASGMLRAITWMHPDSENQYDCDVQKNCFCLVVENFYVKENGFEIRQMAAAYPVTKLPASERVAIYPEVAKLVKVMRRIYENPDPEFEENDYLAVLGRSSMIPLKFPSVAS